MDIARGHLAKMIIMSVLTILAIQVHCSTQKEDAFIPVSSITPQSSLDDYIHYFKQFAEFVPISLATPGASVKFDHHPSTRASSVDLDQLSSHSGIDAEMKRAMNYPWRVLLGKKVEEVVKKVNEVIPSASIVVKKQGQPISVLQNKTSQLVAVLFTADDDIVHGIAALAPYE